MNKRCGKIMNGRTVTVENEKKLTGGLEHWEHSVPAQHLVNACSGKGELATSIHSIPSLSSCTGEVGKLKKN